MGHVNDMDEQIGPTNINSEHIIDYEKRVTITSSENQKGS